LLGFLAAAAGDDDALAAAADCCDNATPGSANFLAVSPASTMTLPPTTTATAMPRRVRFFREYPLLSFPLPPFLTLILFCLMGTLFLRVHLLPATRSCRAEAAETPPRVPTHLGPRLT
jgi:hypothetical protein